MVFHNGKSRRTNWNKSEKAESDLPEQSVELELAFSLNCFSQSLWPRKVATEPKRQVSRLLSNQSFGE
jgi:hypothetical protein